MTEGRATYVARQFTHGEWLQRRDTPAIAGRFMRYDSRLAGYVDVWMPGHYVWIGPAQEWEPTAPRCPECGAKLIVRTDLDDMRAPGSTVGTSFLYCPECQEPRRGMGSEAILRPCKFAGVIECTRSDRSRAECHICANVSGYLSARAHVESEYVRLARESDRLSTACSALEDRVQQLTERCDHLLYEARRAKMERWRAERLLDVARARLEQERGKLVSAPREEEECSS